MKDEDDLGPDASRRYTLALAAGVAALGLALGMRSTAFAQGESVEKWEGRVSELTEYSQLAEHGGKEMGKSLFIRSALLVAGLVLGVTRSRKREVEDHFEKAMANVIFPYVRARFLDWTKVALSKV
ncbi:hypothetical protein AB8A20_02230 [Tardiphaga sp. 604_B6_N1_1]|jgi:hypothetical protein|uniref:hypothetical protein n=1 Tax=unclassified Tardiphaga TaxID=2631404 RepID=UPI003F259E56